MADQEEIVAAEQPTAEEADPAAQLAEAQGRADTYLDLAQRTQADFQNYKRRVEQDRERLIKDANADLIRSILPVLDDMERAVAAAPREIADQSWESGIVLVGQKLRDVLEHQGLARVGEEGERFDPHVHEAVAYQEHPVYTEGQIALVYRAGYRLHDRVIRPAQVVVAKSVSDADSEAGAGHEGAASRLS
ncbi:MAG: nucleotide exchange factor GrpE [Chloroflexota bacterium]